VAVRQYKVIAGINAAERAGPAKTKDRRSYDVTLVECYSSFALDD
jgi:hypothetical protein